jgi:hypothetical protein
MPNKEAGDQENRRLAGEVPVNPVIRWKTANSKAIGALRDRALTRLFFKSKTNPKGPLGMRRGFGVLQAPSHAQTAT